MRTKTALIPLRIGPVESGRPLLSCLGTLRMKFWQLLLEGLLEVRDIL